jgi:L-asparaginase II
MSAKDLTLELLWPKASDFAIVAELVRDGLVESRHWGIAALVGPDGKVIDEIGKSKRLIFPRSSVKPLQAVAARRVGLQLSGAQLAITTGSHQGTAEHAKLVEEITYEPKLATFDMDIMESMGIKEDRIPKKTYWY